jgi:hypothetical protein
MLKEPPNRVVGVRYYSMTPTTWVVSDERANMGTVAAGLAAKQYRKVRVTLRFNFEVDFVVLTDQPSLVQKAFPQLLNLLCLQLLDTFENFHVLPPPKHEATHEIIAHILVGIKITDTKKQESGTTEAAAVPLSRVSGHHSTP